MTMKYIPEKILQILPAAPGWFAVFEGDDDGYGHRTQTLALPHAGMA